MIESSLLFVLFLLRSVGLISAGHNNVAEPVLFIVSYHNLDYAMNACEFVSAQASDACETIRLANRFAPTRRIGSMTL